MVDLKTRPNSGNVKDYLASIEPRSKREDAMILLELFSQVTGYKAVMWGNSIIGFGRYSYSNTTGDYEWLMTGFAPRSRNLTLYVMQGFDNYHSELAQLGKVKHAKSCLYINKLSDIDMNKLQTFLARVVKDMKQLYRCSS